MNVAKLSYGILLIGTLLGLLIINGGKRKMNSFIEKHADSIICEPSGMTYSELKESKIQKMVLVGVE